MAENRSGEWDEDEGYSFSKEDSEKKRVPLPSSSGRKAGSESSGDRRKGKKYKRMRKRRKEREGRDEGGKEDKPVIREDMDFDRMHPDFPDIHDYLQDSLNDIDFMAKRIKAMRRENERDDDEQRVTIRKRPQHENENRGRVEPEEIEQSREFKKRRIRNQAIGKVIRHLKEEGYSQEFIRENRDVIRKKVDSFLFNRDRSL